MKHNPAPKTNESLIIPAIEVVDEDDQTGELMALTVQTTSKDAAAYEVHAPKHGWPTEVPMSNAMFLWHGFVAWSALRREPNAPAKLKTATPVAFMEAIVSALPADESDATVVDPTQADHTSAPDSK